MPGGEDGQSVFGATAVKSIAFGNGIYVAVGAGGKMAWSEDGQTWTAVRPGVASGATRFPATADINSVAFGNGRFVAGGSTGNMAYSANGTNWTAIDPGTVNNATTTFSADMHIRRIVFADGKFCAAGGSVSGFSTIGKGNAAFSGNGAQWTKTAVITIALASDVTNFYSAAFGKGTWVVAGQRTYSLHYSRIFHSTDGGQSWTEASQAQTIFDTSCVYALAFGGGRFVAGDSQGKMAWSDDGATWTAIPPGTEDNVTATFGSSAINDIAFGAGKWIAVGSSGKMAQSEDGAHWAALPPGTGSYTATFGTSSIQGIAFYNGRFYAMGADGKMAYSNPLEEQTGP
jgi:hypothetical protein